MTEVKVTMHNKSPISPPIKVEVDGEEWNNVVKVGWSAKYGEATMVTLTIEAKLVTEYVE